MKDIIAETDRHIELKILLGEFMAEMTRYDSADTLRVLKRENLSMPRIVTLNLVAKRGAVSISEISAWLDLSLGNTSTLVDKLVCHGFVTRAEDANDRRHKLVRLTEKGQALVQELQSTRVESVAQRMAQLPPAVLSRAVEVLSELVAQLPQIGAATPRAPTVTVDNS